MNKTKEDEIDDFMINATKDMNDSEYENVNKTTKLLNELEKNNNVIKYNSKAYDLFKLGNNDSPFCKQIHDEITDTIKRNIIIVKKLLKIEFPEQRSEAWFKLRDGKITASDGGCVVGVNHYEAPFKFIMKKIRKPPFTDNINTWHGKKYEKIACMIYEFRLNVKVEDFGLIAHHSCSFLAASPDGIVGLYKLDGIHKTKYVGRMLEIKCPPSRKIITEGEIYGGICPEYYWVQVQLQLQCCDLLECDFWQCCIREYSNREEFINDTNPNEQFRSKTTNMEKGVVIQLLPKDKINNITDEDSYNLVVYSNAICLYPDKITLTPLELDIWIAKIVSNLENSHPKYYLDKVIYWYLEKAHCCTIKRDDDWYKTNFKTMKTMWNYVQYLRKNKDKCEIVCKFVDNTTNKWNNLEEWKRKKMEYENNDVIMKTIKLICNEPDPKNKDLVKKYNKSIIEIMEKLK